MAVVLKSEQNRGGRADGGSCAMTAQEIRSIRSLLPEAVLLLVGPVTNCLREIHVEERKFVAKAVPRRQAEFATGRVLARRALAELGIPVAAVLQGPMNEPVWPEGATGSITHTVDTCMVAVARNGRFQGLGIDLEARPAEFDGLAHLIVRPEEMQSTGAVSISDRDIVRLLFSAKESIYKALFARVQRFIDFQEIRVVIDVEQSRYRASAPEDGRLHALVSRGMGRFRITDDFVFTIWSYN